MLDEEFFYILEQWRWFRSGLMKLDLCELPYHIAIGIRYLTEQDRTTI